ncbi:MAG: DNA polymerase III subunit alpha, partial [Pseudomonadota bacterium]
ALSLSVMNLDLNLTDKLNAFVQEARRLEIAVAAPCVNRSEARFTVRDGQILYALGALKGVGVEAMRLIEAARAGDGPFRDLFDVARRVELKLLGKRALEMMARAGAFDALDANRARVLASLDRLIEYSAAHAAEQASGQASLFGMAGDGGDALPPPRLPDGEDWLPTDRLNNEQIAVGFYLSGHPLDVYVDALSRRRVTTHRAFLDRWGAEGGSGRIAGTVSGVQIRKSARGTRFAYIQLSDSAGGYEVMAFSDTLAEAEDLLSPGRNVVLTVETEGEAQGGRIRLRAAQPIDEVVAAQSGLRVYLGDPAALPSLRRRLEIGVQAQARQPGNRRSLGPISLVVALPELGREVEVELGGTFPTGPEIRGMLKDVQGVEAVAER